MRAFISYLKMIYVNHPAIFWQIFLFFDKNTCQKEKKCYNVFSWKKERFSYGSHMDSIYPFSGYDLCKLRKEDKKVEQTHQKIRKTSEREIKTCLDF